MFIESIQSQDNFHVISVSINGQLLGTAFKTPSKKWIVTTIYNPMAEYFESPAAATAFIRQEYLKRLWLPS
jgi:hypothetical protein